MTKQKDFAGHYLDTLSRIESESPDHTHVIKVVRFSFEDGTIHPYIEVEESGPAYNGSRVLPIAETVHALLNIKEEELFTIGNRPYDFNGDITDKSPVMPLLEECIDEFLMKLKAELYVAMKKHPGPFKPFQLIAALLEESGEVAKANFDEGKERTNDEAIQCAVICASIYLDNHGLTDQRKETEKPVNIDVDLYRQKYGVSAAENEFNKARPRVVVLCGSTKFLEAWRTAVEQETLDGKVVLPVGVFLHQKTNADTITPEQKAGLDQLHKRKIDMADEVLILNVNGYIGESTKSEIEYAKKHAKPIRYLHPELVLLANNGVHEQRLFIPDIDDVLNDFQTLEESPSIERINEWCKKFPNYKNEIIEHSLVWFDMAIKNRQYKDKKEEVKQQQEPVFNSTEWLNRSHLPHEKCCTDYQRPDCKCSCHKY